MLLAIDTSTRAASIALYDASGACAEATWRTRENHTVELTAQIVHLLELAQIAKRELRAVGIALGPGSFTGLRVGMSVAKGLAFGLQIPLIGIPTLDALAHACAFQPLPIWAILAIGRGKFAVARYMRQAASVKRVGDYMLVDATELANLAAQNAESALYCGDIDAAMEQALRAQLHERAVIATPAMNARRAAYLAELAWARLMRGEADDSARLAPLYLSKP